MKSGMDPNIPDKPGTMIDPGFVSYMGTSPDAISIESVEWIVVTSCIRRNWRGTHLWNQQRLVYRL